MTLPIIKKKTKYRLMVHSDEHIAHAIILGGERRDEMHL